MAKQIKSPPFQQILKERLSRFGISANALEKKAGLKRSAVQNILHGKSKKPSAEILYAISRVLGCSLDELLDTTPAPAQISSDNACPPPPTAIKSVNDLYNPALYAKAVAAANTLFDAKKINPIESDALRYISDIYSYSLKSEKEDIDLYFCNWHIDNLFSK